MQGVSTQLETLGTQLEGVDPDEQNPAVFIASLTMAMLFLTAYGATIVSAMMYAWAIGDAIGGMVGKWIFNG